MTYTSLEISLRTCLAVQHPMYPYLGLVDTFLHQENLPSLLQNFTLAILTVLIPFAIALFQTILTSKDVKDELESFNVFVVVDSVLAYRQLIFALIMCFTPTLFWEATPIWGRACLLFLWIGGMIILIKILRSNIKWVKGGANKIRLDYAQSLRTSNPQIAEIWFSIWKTTRSLGFEEKNYLNAYVLQMDYLIKKEEYKKVEQMINVLLENIKFRNPLVLASMSDFMPHLLNWHKLFWTKSHELMGIDPIEQWGQQEDLLRKSDEMLSESIRMIVMAGHLSLFLLKFEPFIETNRELNVVSKGETYWYMESALQSFMHRLLDETENVDIRYQKWRWGFPDTWRITKISMSGERKTIIIMLFNTYINWLREQLDKEDNNYYADYVTSELLPDIDPIIWGRLVDFAFSSFSESRARSMVKKPWRVGNIGRVKTYNGDISKKQMQVSFSNELRETFVFVYSVRNFADVFSERNLKSYMNDLKTYDASDDKEKKKKDSLLSTFAEMLAFIKK